MLYCILFKKKSIFLKKNIQKLFFEQVTAPRDITILMSAVRSEPEPHPSDSGKLVHQFLQKVPIPTYLIAIVGGDLESR